MGTLLRSGAAASVSTHFFQQLSHNRQQGSEAQINIDYAKSMSSILYTRKQIPDASGKNIWIQ